MFSTAACALAFRCGSACLHQKHRSAQVDVVRLGQRLGGDLTERLGQCVGGVVDHDVDAAELVDGALDQGAEVVDVAEVRRHADGLAAEAAQVLGGLLAGVGLAAGDHDAGAGKNETLRKSEADTSGAARHDDGAAGHVEETLKRFAIHAAQ